MRFRQLIEDEDFSDVPSSGLRFTQKKPNLYVVTHGEDEVPVFYIQRTQDKQWRATDPQGSIILAAHRNRNTLFQKVKQFYDDREEMTDVGMHPNMGRADEIAQHLFNIFKTAGKDGNKAVQREFQDIIDRDQPMRWEIAVIKDKFFELANPMMFEARIATLKKNEKSLTADERKEVKKSGAHIWKAVDPDTGEVTYVASTHRAADTAPTLKGAIAAWNDHIESTG